MNLGIFTDVRWETTGYVGVGKRGGPDDAARNYFARTPAKLFRKSPALADTRILSIMNTKQQRKIIQIKARITEVQHVGLVWQAQHAGMT